MKTIRKSRMVMPMMEGRLDPARDAVNRQERKLPLIFGDRFFEEATT